MSSGGLWPFFRVFFWKAFCTAKQFRSFQAGVLVARVIRLGIISSSWLWPRTPNRVRIHLGGCTYRTLSVAVVELSTVPKTGDFRGVWACFCWFCQNVYLWQGAFFLVPGKFLQSPLSTHCLGLSLARLSALKILSVGPWVCQYFVCIFYFSFLCWEAVPYAIL